MSKSREKALEKARPAAVSPGRAAAQDDAAGSWGRTLRETVESIVIAFVLAFLFRTFEAEAFVIPTGSMAPTLRGRHRDVECPECHFRYPIGAKREEDDSGGPDRENGDIPWGICPMCRYKIDFARMTPEERRQYPIYNGDRILVNKFAFDLAEPDRWDVIVFRYPEDSKTNYIKRLIGLPNDVVLIRDGDIYISRDQGKTFEIARKSPPKLRAMLQIVYDNDYVDEKFLQRNWPARWQSSGVVPWVNPQQADGKPDNTVFVTDGKTADGRTPGEAWLQYYNYVPSQDDWYNFLHNNKPLAYVNLLGRNNPEPVPIDDDNAYNDGGPSVSGQNTVTDLAIECQADVQAAAGKIVLELSKKGKRFRCQLDLAQGTAQLEIPGLKPEDQPTAGEGCISAAGSYRLCFVNVDHQLTLFVNDTPVKFNKSCNYDLDENGVNPGVGAEGDNLPPASLGSLGASLRVSHLRIFRDVYYTYPQEPLVGPPRLSHPSFERDPVTGLWPDASKWYCFPEKEGVENLRLARFDVHSGDQFFFVGEDKFFVLGDNSPLSLDGRLWMTVHFVDRKLLIGKALFIYWPHSFDYLKLFDDHKIPLPFFPNFSRMGFVR